MNILTTRRELVEHVAYVRSFHWRDDPGAGFSFDCDESGAIDRAALYPEAIENLDKCLDGSFDVVDDGVEKREWQHWEPAQGRCPCGEIVYLDHFTNTCRCGRDYDSSGNELAPRDQWGEETGEHWADILRIP